MSMRRRTRRRRASSWPWGAGQRSDGSGDTPALQTTAGADAPDSQPLALVASGGAALGTSTRDGQALHVHEKKKQRLLQKTESRPTEMVMRVAPVGAAQIRDAPRLGEFRDAAATAEECTLLPATAVCGRLDGAEYYEDGHPARDAGARARG